MATVANSPPTISNVDITFTNDVAHCNATIHDPDVSDVVTSEVQWINNGVPLEVTGSPALLSSLPPCTQLSCQITAHDGSATTTVTSDPAFNENPIACGQAPCTVWECTPDGCSASTLNGPCDDGDPCTTEGVCNGSICETAPLPNDICDDNNPCTQDVCEANNGCVYVPQPNTPCDADGSVCTTNDSCNQQGVCVPGAAISCDDGIACTPDTCEPTTGCTALLDSADVGFAVQFGTTQEFIAYEDEAETELVQGPQGGEHIEFSLKYTLPSAFDWQPLRSRVIVTLRSPCCGTGMSIGGMYLPNVLSDIEGPNTFVSGTLLGIFDQVINVGATVCATVEVSIYDEVGTSIIATSIARHMFTIVDEQ